MYSSDPCLQFAEAIYGDTGANIDPLADGLLHRFDDPQGRRHNRACWYVLHLKGLPAGAYGNWRTGFQTTWRAHSNSSLTSENRERMRASLQLSQLRREQEKIEAQAAAARSAAFLWSEARPATEAHPYLARKGIPALGLRQQRETLLVPLRDISGELINLQRIHPDGTKRFLNSGRISGCFWLLGEKIPDTGKLYLAEGAATAATIAQTLQLPVAAAMNAGNLAVVARAIRERYPRLALVVAADNDHRTPGNPGITKALDAARAVQGEITWPTTCRELDCICTDFNDTAHCGRAPR